MALELTAPPDEMRWGTYPIFCQGTRRRAVIERLKSRASPLGMGAVPSSALMVVDLPDPFDPVMATVWPAGMDRVIPWRIRSVSQATCRLSSRTTAGASAWEAPAVVVVSVVITGSCSLSSGR